MRYLCLYSRKVYWLLRRRAAYWYRLPLHTRFREGRWGSALLAQRKMKSKKAAAPGLSGEAIFRFPISGATLTFSCSSPSFISRAADFS